MKTTKQAISVDTSTSFAFISIRDKNGTFYSLSIKDEKKSENLLLGIDNLLDSLDDKKIDELYVTKGPGSFTGLRIGMSTIKGISSALDIPVFTLSTLSCYAYSAYETLSNKSKLTQDDLIMPVIDARKNRYYVAGFVLDSKANVLNEVLPDSDISLEEICVFLRNQHYSRIYFVVIDDIKDKISTLPLKNSEYEIINLNDCSNPAEVLIKKAKDKLKISQGATYIRPVDAKIWM